MHFWDQIRDSKGQTFPPDTSPWFKAQLSMIRNTASTGVMNLSWWDAVKTVSTLQDEMTYTCDAALGVPKEADCKQLEFSQLGPPSDTISLSSGSIERYSSNDCSFTVEASLNIVITWAQITAALDALVDLCVSTPRSATGGRAYFSSTQHPKRDVISGR